MDVNEDSVAPWKADGVDDDDACAAEDRDGGGGGACAVLGMNDVTTATGCAISRRSARILWESPRTLLLRLEEGQRFAVASASVKRDMVLEGFTRSLPCLGTGQCLYLLGSLLTDTEMQMEPRRPLGRR